jgi:hypothetical protein
MKPLTAVFVILGLAAVIVLSVGLWFRSSARNARTMTAASEACMNDPTMKKAPLGSDARADAYERCLIEHGVPASDIPKRTDIAH